MLRSVSRHRAGLRDLVDRDRVRPVVVTAPYSPEECVRLLAQVTTGRKSGWYLDARAAGRPDPVLHGQVGPSQVRVTMFSEVTSEGRYHAQSPVWLDAAVAPGPEGGTVLTGTVGSRPAPALARLSNAVSVAWAAVGLLMFGIGIAIAAAGHFNAGVGVAIGLPVIVVLAFLATRGSGAGTAPDDERIPRLLRRVDHILDATSAAEDPAPAP